MHINNTRSWTCQSLLKTQHSLSTCSTLTHGSALQGGKRTSDAEFWQSNAVAVVERLEVQYPLYRDVVQPIKQGILEVCKGLSQSLHAAAVSTHAVWEALAHLVHFPRFHGMVGNPLCDGNRAINHQDAFQALANHPVQHLDKCLQSIRETSNSDQSHENHSSPTGIGRV